MENIEEDLDQKNIERPGGPEEEIIEPSPEPEPLPPAKTKKVRSEAQKAAFERAKIKRAENIKKRKELKEQEKLEKKVAKTQITERIKEELHKETEVKEVKAPRQTSLNNSREQIVQNHYYYYGMPPPVDAPERRQKERKKKGKKVKRPPTPPTESSSEEEFSDVDEPDTYQDQYNTQPIDNYDIPPEPKIPKFKFGFV
tara:strand:- start:2317 stop:2913 length:597 start_codon:yes stop_codon:yes gene_type:complete